MLQWEGKAQYKDGLEHEELDISEGTWPAAGPACQGLQITPMTSRGAARPGAESRACYETSTSPLRSQTQ